MGNNQKKFSWTDFSGGIRQNAGPLGLGASEKKVYWDDSFNVEIFKNKGVATCKGNVQIAQSPDREGILGIFEVKENSSDFLFVTESGKICYFTAVLGTVSELKTLNACPERFSAINFLNGILILTGTNRIQYVKIGSEPEISEVVIKNSAGEEVFGTAIAKFASRVWVSEGATLYFSSLGTYDIWDEAENSGYISKFHVSESEIVAMTDYAGKLAIYKTDGVYLLTGFNPEDFSIVKFGNISVMSTAAVVSANNKQFFMNKHGIYALEQFGELAQIALNTTISDNIKKEFLNFDMKKARFSAVLHNFEKNQIWFFTPNKDYEGVSCVLIYDYILHAWAKRLIPFAIQAAANVCGKILTASKDGQIFQENVGNTFSGKPIEFGFKTPFFTFGDAGVRKTVGNSQLILDESFQNSFKFSVFKDFKRGIETDCEYCQTISPKTLVFATSEGEGGKYLSTWADSENCGFSWAEPFEEGLNAEIFDSCTSFQINISSQTAGDAFGLVGVEFSEITFD